MVTVKKNYLKKSFNNKCINYKNNSHFGLKFVLNKLIKFIKKENYYYIEN